MTEYTVKEIGHQWIVYADRQSIAACADETSALKLIAEDSAANGVTRKSRVLGQAKTHGRVAAHVPSDRRLGDLEAELEQLTMNTRRAPKCVRTAHLANERAQPSRDLLSANTVV